MLKDSLFIGTNETSSFVIVPVEVKFSKSKNSKIAKSVHCFIKSYHPETILWLT